MIVLNVHFEKRQKLIVRGNFFLFKITSKKKKKKN